MPQLDASLIGGFRPIEIPDQTNMLMKALQIQHLQQQQQLGQVQVEQHQNALTKAAGIENTIRQLGPTATPQQISQALTGQGYGAEGLEYQKTGAEIDNKTAQTGNYQASAAKARADVEHQQIMQTGSILGAAAQAGPQAVMDTLMKSPTIPNEKRQGLIDQAQRDPIAFARQYAQGTATWQQQQEAAARQAQIAETGRHDQATEATARGQLGVSQGHLAVSRQAEARQAAQGAATVAQGKIPSGYRATADGGLEFIPGGPADPKRQGDKPLTESQSNAALFGRRAAEADSILRDLDGKYSPTGVAVANMSGIGPATNIMRTDNTQRATQAQTDFMTAVLRKESGASISTGEFETARKQYFPQPGDSQAVIAQKAANRKTAIEGIALGAGSAGAGIKVNAPAGAKFLGFE